VSRINSRRVLFGGIAAGVVMNIMDAVTNGVLMLSELQANAARLGLTLTGAESWPSMAALAAVDVVFGVVLVWLYAALRPTLGRGVKTALVAALAMYLSTMGILVGFALMGVVTAGIFIKMAIAGALTLAVGGMVGARLYRD
jgi:hypothetical protein